MQKQMLNRLRLPRRFAIALLLLAIFLFPQISIAQDSSASTADKLLGAVEELVYCRQQLALRDSGDASQSTTVDLLEQKIKFLEEKIVLYVEMISMQKDFDAKKDVLHKQEIDAIKPTFWGNAKLIFEGMGIAGILIAIAAVL